MPAYRLSLTLNDPVYYATRELGRSYQSGEYLHNYALTYALGLAVSDYHDTVQVPRYREHLAPLNDQGIYVTPARPEAVSLTSHTFKFADTRYHVRMEQSSVNLPTFGRARELAPGSTFTAYALTREAQRWPRWIRLGKWFGKAEVKVQPLGAEQRTGPFMTEHPLNPLDTGLNALLFDIINMPPVSLIDHARFEGRHWHLTGGPQPVQLPADLAYRFP